MHEMVWLLVALFVQGCALTGASTTALWWDGMVQANLTYDEQVTAYAAQGLMNRMEMQVFFNIGKMNFDWHEADVFWKNELEKSGQALFTTIPPNLCALVSTAASTNAVAGFVVYPGDSKEKQYGDGFSTAIALTLAGQENLVPVSAKTLKSNPCLSDTGLSVKQDLRHTFVGETRVEAWNWAVSKLLPKSSKKTIFNLNHFRVAVDPLPFKHDKQSNATASSIDYAVQQNAFVLDLESHSSSPKGGTAPWSQDDEFIQEIFGHMDPLFDAYGWADDEFSWTNITSHYGGTIMCSFSSENLSFWAKLKLKDGRAKARRLPRNDRGIILDRKKYYVTFETNEGDTPRLLVSAMVSAWASPQRGSLPIAWAIDPLLAERFPALFDFYASTATRNDSFIAGTAGAGYVFLNQLSKKQLQVYGNRVGALISQYGPTVIDTYGYANLTVHENYRQAIIAGGSSPDAFVTQPNWPNVAYAPFHCSNNSNMVLKDGTPLVCTSGKPKLFYYSDDLNTECPSCDLADRIEKVAREHPPPYFVLAYGGLQAAGGADVKSNKNFFPLLQQTIKRLGDDFITVGATEMARLAHEAGHKLEQS